MKLALLLNSIRGRLLLWMGFLLALVLGGFGFTAIRLHRNNQLGQIDEQLQQRLSFLSAAVRTPPGREGFRGPGSKRMPPDFRDGPEEFDLDRPAPSGGPHGPGGPHDRGMRGGPPRGGGPRDFRGGPAGFGGGPMWPPDRMFEQREIQLSGEALRLFDESNTNSFYYAIWSRGGTLLKSASNSPPNFVFPSQNGRDTTPHTQTRDDFREAYHFTERGDCVLAGISLGTYFQDMRGFTLRLGAAGFAVLSLGLGGAWWLATHAIRPLDEISATANRIAAGNLSERINTGDTVDELGRLARVLNSTFARLEAAFAQQKQFTADASHELRTPLAVIISESQSALNRPRPVEEYQESLKVCHDAAQQMRSLADSLLELARFDAGQERLEREELDLARLAESTLALLRPLAREKGVELHTDLSRVWVAGDSGRLSQVLTNLLQNAVYYNKPGGRVNMSISAMNRTAVLRIADNGVGIPGTDLPHIFERFYRADKARVRHEGHAGLGLAITKAIVELHNGSISVQSIVGEGSAFTVTLPMIEPEQESSAA